MEQIALHTRIAEGREADYDREHARIPDELDASLRAAGIWARAFAGDGIRISIGSPEANAALAGAIISALQDAPAHV